MAAHSKPGISVINATKNRDNIYEAVPSWLACEEITEVVVVDWGSDVPIRFDDPRVRVARREQETWLLSHAFNYAASLASYPLLLKLDADYVLHPDFCKRHVLKGPGKYYCGDRWWQERWNNGLDGLVFVHRDDFEKAGGYNEDILWYGSDDYELYRRLDRLPSIRMYVYEKYVRHVPHSWESRLRHKMGALSLAEQIDTSLRVAEHSRWDAGRKKWFEKRVPLS